MNDKFSLRDYPLKAASLYVSALSFILENTIVKAGGEIEQADKFGMTGMDYAKNSKEITEILKKEIDRIEKLFMKG